MLQTKEHGNGPTDQRKDTCAAGPAPHHDDRVSLTIDHDTPKLMAITGLSMAAHAHLVTDQAEAEKVLRMLPLKYPQQIDLPMQMPAPADVRIFRVTPTVISVLDYSQGFGHTDLVTC